MEAFTLKTITTSRNFTYAYYVHKPANISQPKPALIAAHGFPDDKQLWADIVPALVPLGHPIVVPDMLGYDGSSKPTDPAAYSYKLLADDLYELLDSEGLDTIIPVGHDWGSAMAQRLYNWRPERCAGLILLNVAYRPPASHPFDMEAVLDLTEKQFGHPIFAYWEFFTAADAPRVIDDNLETFFHLLHWDDPDAMFKLCCVRGATRRLVTEGKPEDYPLKPYAQKPGFKEAFMERFRRDRFDAPLCWYKAVAQNYALEHERQIPAENYNIKVPCLYISTTGDPVCGTDRMEHVRPLVPELQVHIIEANHWVPYEKPEEIHPIMSEWLQKKYPDTA